MSVKARRWLLSFLTAGGVAFAGLNVVAYNQAHAMLYFARGGSRTSQPARLTTGQKLAVLWQGVNVPRPRSDRQPAELDPACQRLSIRCPDGVALGGWYVDRGERSPLVMLFHGYAVEKTCLLPEARAFLQLGASVLLIDFRGSGESSESYTTIGVREADDVSAVVAYARLSLPHSSVILYGQSMGAVAILRAVQADHLQPDAVIVEAVFDTMLHTVEHRFEALAVPAFPNAELLVFWGGVQTGFNGFANNPVAYAQALRCPVLFMHGAADREARVAEGRRVFAAVPGEKQFKEFASVGHESYVRRFPMDWKATVGEFLGRVPSSTTARAGGAATAE